MNPYTVPQQQTLQPKAPVTMLHQLVDEVMNLKAKCAELREASQELEKNLEVTGMALAAKQEELAKQFQALTEL